MDYKRKSSNSFNFWNKDSADSSPLFVSGLNNGPSVLNSSVQIRLAYLRKVYGILSVQLGLTTILSSAIMGLPAIQSFIITNPWLLIVNFLANIITMFALLYKRSEYPANFYLLGAFTFFNSFTLGCLISNYDLTIVIQAFFITTAIVVGLTLYTLNSKHDFSYLGGILSSLLLISFLGSILHLMFGNSTTDTLLSVFGAFIFSTYIIYDTHLIMKHLSAEEYIIGVVNLYMDIINLFIKILRILDALKRQGGESSESRKDKKKRN